jgi:peptidylprolyl isomerase
MSPRIPRFVGALSASTLILLAACGDSPESAESQSPSTIAAAESGAGGATEELPSETPEVDPAAPAEPAAPVGASEVATKPVVEIPDELPTELVITDLIEGEGPEAAVGDVVTVNYVGVRSADGTEFDNSYDRGSPFPVNLGSGGVIAGWEQGLLGVKAGGRRQLDIPANLAYGDNPQGDVIQAGDALTFVIDVVSIEAGPEPLPETNPADEPTITIEGGDNVDALVIEDLVVGDGDELVAGATGAAHIIAYRADTGEQISSTWIEPTAIEVIADPQQMLPGLAEGLIGMKVGGRRQLNIPFLEAFGETGNEQMGLPAGVDLIVVVDLLELR